MGTIFGEYLKKLRSDRRITLRSFCEKAGLDPANYSKIERGLLTPPLEESRLASIVKALGCTVEGAEHRELRRLASLDRGQIPPRILSDAEIAGRLPALFRTMEGEPVDEASLKELVDMIQKNG
jgi:transcriptional regulator with XRE-family HTH domain